MRAGARIAAAIEVLSELEARRRPAADAVKDWMLSHRFAGSKDRAAIGDLVFCALRWRQSSAWRLKTDTARAQVLGALVFGVGETPESLDAALTDDPHAPASLSAEERRLLAQPSLDGAPAFIAGDYPEWAASAFVRAFGDQRVSEGQALAVPAPLDLRVNTLKADHARVLAALAEHPRLVEAPTPTPHAPSGLRVRWAFGRSFNWTGEVAFEKGWFEIQDEGSQLAATLSGVTPGMQVADVCAGGGGKSLAMAAAMANTGQIYAFDVNSQRLGPLVARLDRAGARNVQVRPPARGRDVLADLAGKMDLALVDAPCTGSGTWRRAPDAKWRVRDTALAMRNKDQHEALALGARLVKPGGALAYVTCSVFPEENEDVVAGFLAGHTDFSPVPIATAAPHWPRHLGVQFTPARTGTDGFYVARLRRRG